MNLTVLRLLLCLSVASAALAVNTPADLPQDWGNDIKDFKINDTFLGMSKAAVTNASTQYRALQPPESNLDVLSYLVVAVSEDKVGIGNARPDVTINVIKNVFFNQNQQVVAIEMVFTNLDADKRRYALDRLDNKYDTLPTAKKDFYRYSVSPSILLETTVVPTDSDTSIFLESRPTEFTIRNFYYHKAKYREALQKTKKQVVLDDLI